MKLMNAIFGKGKDKNQLKLTKQSGSEWVVKKGTTVLYIGSKDMCQTYMSNVVA